MAGRAKVSYEAIPAEEAAAVMDIDGKFVAAWRDRVAGADGYDIVAIVERDVTTCEGSVEPDW